MQRSDGMRRSDRRAEPSLTVVSIWHNRVSRVASSISSLLTAGLPNTSYLIIDDGSTDGTAEALEAATTANPDATVIRQANEGFSHAIWRWTKEVSTPYFALHGAGDLSAPERLYRQLVHAEGSGAVVVGCGVGTVGPDGVTSDLERLPRDVASGVAERPPRPGTHGAALIRTEAFRAAGGYRPEFRYSQDADLWFRMSALGAFSGVPELLYWKYRGDGDTVSRDPSKRFAQALYGELARQCMEDRIAGRPDLVEEFGPDAVLFLRDTERLRKRLIRNGIHSGGLAAMRGVLASEQSDDGGFVQRGARAGFRRLRGMLP